MDVVDGFCWFRWRRAASGVRGVVFGGRALGLTFGAFLLLPQRIPLRGKDAPGMRLEWTLLLFSPSRAGGIANTLRWDGHGDSAGVGRTSSDLCVRMSPKPAKMWEIRWKTSAVARERVSLQWLECSPRQFRHALLYHCGREYKHIFIYWY